MPHTDAELLNRYATVSDEAAFGEWVGRHGRLVIGTAQRKLGAGPLAEEGSVRTTALIHLLPDLAARVKERMDHPEWFETLVQVVIGEMDPRQAAEALGLGLNRVYKEKQRLRERFRETARKLFSGGEGRGHEHVESR